MKASVALGAATGLGAAVAATAAEPPPAPPGGAGGPAKARIIYASAIPGVVLDCDIATGTRIGGGEPTDNAAKLNAVLAEATPTNPVHLIVDGGSALGAALVIPSGGNVMISGLGWNTGFFVLSGSNCGAIETANVGPTNLDHLKAVHPTGLQPITGHNVVLRDFFINANRGVYPNGCVDSTGGWDGTISGPHSPDARGLLPYYFLTTITMVGIQNLRLINVCVYDPTSYAFNPYACGDVLVQGCRFECNSATNSIDAGSNTAGVQTEGRCFSVTIRDSTFVNIGDDAIAFNADEGDQQFPGVNRSPISCNDYLVDNCEFHNCLNAGRIYGSYAQTSRITWRNCRGTIRFRGIVIGDEGATSVTDECNHSVFLENLDFQLTTANYFDATSLVSICANAGLIEIVNCKRPEPAVSVPMIRFGINGVHPRVSSLRISGCQIHRNSVGSAPASLLLCQSGTIGSLAIEGFRLTEQYNQSYPDIATLIDLAGTTVNHLSLDAEVRGAATVLTIRSDAAVGDVAIGNLTHESHAASPTGYAIASTAGAPVPISVERYRGTNVAGLAASGVTLTGPGILPSGFPVADVLMGDNSLYLGSDHQNLPCIKIAGAAGVVALG